VADVPELQELVAKGTIDPNLLMNPYEGLAIKPDGSPYRFANSPFFMGVDYLVNNEGIIASLCKRAGGEYSMFDPGADIQKELAWIEDIIALDRADIIILLPVDEKMSGTACKLAMEAGIPVFPQGVDLADPDAKVTVVRRHWVNAGANVIGQWFVDYAEETGEELHLFEVWGMRSLDIEQERHTGFRKPVDQCDLITVMESADTDFTDEKTADLVIDAFTAYPELNAIYVHGGGGTGAIEGLRAIGRLVPADDPNHVITALNDCDTVTVEALDEGRLDAFGTHGPWDLGDTAVKLALTYAVLGQPVVARVDIAMQVCTIENIDTLRQLGGPAAWPRMPAGQWDLWPVLDATELGIETPTVEMRMQLQGY